MASQRDLAGELLGLARDDEAAAVALLDVGTVSTAIIGFHAQQAVEKALKSVLALGGVDFPFTHDIGGLVELCEEAGRIVPAGLGELDELTPYGVRFRYGPIDEADLVSPATAIAWARETIAWAQGVLDAG